MRTYKSLIKHDRPYYKNMDWDWRNYVSTVLCDSGKTECLRTPRTELIDLINGHEFKVYSGSKVFLRSTDNEFLVEKIEGSTPTYYNFSGAKTVNATPSEIVFWKGKIIESIDLRLYYTSDMRYFVEVSDMWEASGVDIFLFRDKPVLSKQKEILVSENGYYKRIRII